MNPFDHRDPHRRDGPRGMAFGALFAAGAWIAAALFLKGCAPPAHANTEMPPAQYQGDGMSVVILTDHEHIRTACGDGKNYVLGCTKNTWLMMENPARVPPLLWPDWVAILIHEWGHHNGWPADHPRR